MDSKGAPPTQVYEDIVPTTELVQEQDFDILLLDLTGFKKEQVRVQLTREGILKISGQRPVAGQKKWLRFQKDFPVSENCDKTKVSAEFENGILYVKQPKLITSSGEKDQELPTPNAQQPKKPAEEPQPQKKDEEQTKGEKTPTPKKPAEEPQPPKKDEEQTKGEKTPTPKKPEEEPQPPKKDEEQTKGEKTPTPKKPAEEPQPPKKDEEQTKEKTPTPKKPAEEPQPPKKDEEQTKGEKTPTPTQTPTPTPTEELPKHQTNADKPEKEEPNTKEAKDLAGKTPVEKTDPSSTVEDGNYESKLEMDANIGTAAALAEKLKMPRKVMNMTLIALLVLGIGLYISNMMKSNNYEADK